MTQLVDITERLSLVTLTGVMSVLVPAAIANYHRLSSLNNKKLLLTVLEGRSPRSRHLHIQRLVRAIFLSDLHMGEREKALICLSF